MESSCGSNSKEESGSTGWFDQRETIDEELPLTFSNTLWLEIFQEKPRRFGRCADDSINIQILVACL